MENHGIIIENSRLRLSVDENCIVRSLICLENGEECLVPEEEISLFSVTQERPYNNEVKLSHPNKRTTFEANSVRRDGDLLTIGFEIIPYSAVVRVTERPDYIVFTLESFIVKPEDYLSLSMKTPPVAEFRLLQLPVRKRTSFGEWLNVAFDDNTAVNVLGVSPHTRIDSERRRSCRIMTADAVQDIRLIGCSAALITAPTKDLLDCIDQFEADFGLPRGVESRRSPEINRSAYWTQNADPSNIDKHIEYAKRGGFSMMLLYYPCIFKTAHCYGYCGNYDYRDEYPNGAEDVRHMLDRIKAAGITPGFHFLQTHIGMHSRYITPTVDYRINLKRRFTLSRPLSDDPDGEIDVYVEENPTDSVLVKECRYLRFDGELISYTDYVTEYPYRFTGCRRGEYNTTVTAHNAGCSGGILDISEFSATSAYIDQNTSLQDEIADKLADAYNAGFEFVYLDGSEGTNPPFEFHVPNAQYRVWKKLGKKPLFMEGAAKSHFSWHMLSGGNAFDVFNTSIFKEKIIEHPVEEAPRMRQDFTRLNFGWWAFFEDTMPDTYEFGTSRAAAWDCPATVMENFAVFEKNPRTDDVLEVTRRWEDVRATGWLSEEQKLMLRDTTTEHTLLLTPNGYELVPYSRIESPEGIDAYYFTRSGKNYITYWHRTGSCRLKLCKELADVSLEINPDCGAAIDFENTEDGIVIPVGAKMYLSTSSDKDTLTRAFRDSIIIQ